MKRVTSYSLDRDLKWKIKCAAMNRQMTAGEFIEKAVYEYLKNNPMFVDNNPRY